MSLPYWRQRWFGAGFLFVFCWLSQTLAHYLPDSSYSMDKKNALWREEYQYTGERRGPNTSRKQQQRKPSPPPTYSNLLKGGSLEVPQEEENAVTPYDKLLQWKRKRGKISIDLGEPKEEEPTATTVRRVLLGTPSSSNSTAANQALVVPLTQKLESLNIPCNEKIEISVSVDPSSFVRLVLLSVKASAGLLGAFVATLRLLAPMIVARRFLATLGYICYDYYNGRYLRTTYNKRLRHMQEYEIISAIRACGRAVVQVLGMGLVGKLLETILNLSPCWMATRICEYWHGMVWMVGILIAARASEVLMTTCPPLQICPVESRNQYSPTRVFTRPWHLLQWMKDPEEWINNIARLNNNNRRGGRAPFQPDALLFPSTWPPLHVLSCVGMIRAIRMSLSLDDSLRSSSSIMRNACVQLALYEEWHRVFLQEKRVALGVVVQVVSFLALLNLVYVISMVDGVAGVLLTPALLASLVSGWMNIVLYNERVLVQKKPNGKTTRSERNSKRSRSVVVVAGS